ncbi:MAG: MBL fold metallo-hydrolase [Bacteroidota bacterium]|nr:MBL fold metallo-hydrolase [Bacteroidota bacterium]
MKITFLGTGTSQGIPIIGSTHPVCLSNDPKDKRLRVSVWVRWNNSSYIIDCGPDFRQQVLRSGCSQLDGILFTHEHADHTAGLDDIRPFCHKQEMKLPIYLHKRVLASLEKRFDYIFEKENRYPGAPEVEPFVINGEAPFEIGNKKVIPINVMHGKLPIFGFRIDDFTYITDAKEIAQEEIEKIKGTKVLVINALREEPHQMHFSLDEALDFIQKVQPQQTYLTHISPMLGFHQEVQKKLPENVYLAYDQLEIEI